MLPHAVNDHNQPERAEMDSSIDASVNGSETSGTDLSINENLPSSSSVLTEPLREVAAPYRKGEIIAGQEVLPPLSRALNSHAALSVVQLLENDDLRNGLQRLIELSLTHSVQSVSKKALILLRLFRSKPTIEGWKQIGDTIKKLLEGNPNESSELLKVYKNLSEYHEHFFNIQQQSCNAENVISCYGKPSPESDSIISSEVALPACLIHAFIGKTYRQCSQILSEAMEQSLRNGCYSISEISKSLIQEGKNSEIYELLCGKEAPLSSFSIGLGQSDTLGRCLITMQWHIPEEMLPDWLEKQEKLETKIADSNKMLHHFGCCLSLRLDNDTLNIDFELPTFVSKDEDTFISQSNIKVNLPDEMNLTLKDITLIISHDVLENNPEQVGLAIRNAQEIQRDFSNSDNQMQLYFFSQQSKDLIIGANKQESKTVPFVQLHCPPFKMSLPLTIFNATEPGQEGDKQDQSKSSFLRSLHEIDNLTLIKELSLGYNAFSDEFNTVNILNALKAYARVAVEHFPGRSLTLTCKKDDTGHIWARIGFNPDMLNTDFKDDPICASNAVYDVHGFFRGVMESKESAKALAARLKEFPKEMPLKDLAKQIKGVAFDQNLLNLFKELPNRKIIEYVLTNRVLWCSGEKGFFIGGGRAFIPDSWEE